MLKLVSVIIILSKQRGGLKSVKIPDAQFSFIYLDEDPKLNNITLFFCLAVKRGLCSVGSGSKKKSSPQKSWGCVGRQTHKSSDRSAEAGSISVLTKIYSG